MAENWDTETLINFLRDLNINLDEDDFKILRKEKIDGQIFPDMTEKKFMKDGMKRGPAMKLEKQAKILKEKMRAFEKGKIEYFWLYLSVQDMVYSTFYILVDQYVWTY